MRSPGSFFNLNRSSTRCSTAASITILILLLLGNAQQQASSQAPKATSKASEFDSPLVLNRAVRPWEFTSALGTRSGLLGQESGNLEAWVYPLKILRNFQLRFRVDNEVLDASNLARSVQVRPEATTIIYVWDTFSVKETLFAPRDEPGAIIHLEIDSTEPMEIEASFERDFQIEWPGAMGGSDIEWNSNQHAFFMDENQHKFSALVGSPTATLSHVEFASNYAWAKTNSLRLGVTQPGKATKELVIAASFEGLPAVDVTYHKLLTSYPSLLAASSAFYNDYLKSHIRVQLPDQQLQQAFEWAQVSVLQGVVNNPYLGTGLVAGYKQSSEDDQRPGYAWFFGRDALWTSLALNAEGDFQTTRTALTFLSKYQRKDGKITHEIAQGASFVPWFESMPYAYAAADATPLYIVAMEDYVHRSGDLSFVTEKWESLARAYAFIVSTYDQNQIPKNEGVGHGWVEGGPLLPVKNELYQASVVTQALQSLSYLAHRLGKEEDSLRLSREYEASKLRLNTTFWIGSAGRYAFALDRNNMPVDTPSVLATVPMWFGLLDADKAQSMIHNLDGHEVQTSWGTRIIADNDKKYDAAGYHSGTVWPLFTGWASVAEYRYHQALPGYANLRSNALLTFDGSLGHVTEVLSGTYYQTLSSASPHQIWSSAMVISPILTGLLGLDTEAQSNLVSFSPHVPMDWKSLSVENIKSGACTMDLRYDRSPSKIILKIDRSAVSTCSIDFAPDISRRTQVVSVKENQRSLPFKLEQSEVDQHVKIHLDLPPRSGSADPVAEVSIQLKNDFGLTQSSQLPHLGGINEGLRVVSEQWSPQLDFLTLDTASPSDGAYELGIAGAEEIDKVDGAELVGSKDLTMNTATLKIEIHPKTGEIYPHQQVVIHFRPRKYVSSKNKGN